MRHNRRITKPGEHDTRVRNGRSGSDVVGRGIIAFIIAAAAVLAYSWFST